LVTIVVLLQQATLTGYTIITTIISGQALSALSNGELSLNAGIALTAILSLIVSFMGYHILHNFERYAWIPTIIGLIAALGVGGKDLVLQADPAPPTTVTIITFGSNVASLAISWVAVVSDFSVYISPTVPR
jgi:purine-cytosine permease-like protein